jgi:DNA-directed RNA polymerase specialized sigma24 family protein
MHDAAFLQKRKTIERLLRQWQNWGSLVESHGLMSITTPDGEEYHYLDMLEGLNALPPRQREAVWLMCVEDLSETTVAKIMKFDNVEVTPCQQYKSYGLNRLVAYLESDPETQKEMKNAMTKYGKNGPRKKRVKKVKPEVVDS